MTTLKDLLQSDEWQTATRGLQEARAQYAEDAKDLWESLSEDDRLKLFLHVISTIHQGDVIDQGSYRHVLYDRFGFGPESYGIGMDAGYLNIHNLIGDGMELQEIRSARNIHLKGQDGGFVLPILDNERARFSFDKESRTLTISSEPVSWLSSVDSKI